MLFLVFIKSAIKAGWKVGKKYIQCILLKVTKEPASQHREFSHYLPCLHPCQCTHLSAQMLCLHFSFLLIGLGRQQIMTQTMGTLPSTWDIWIAFLAPEFGWSRHNFAGIWAVKELVDFFLSVSPLCFSASSIT